MITITDQDIARESMLQFFSFGHLPPHLAAVSQPFAELALAIERDLPRNPERTTALRKLLESKDCAVRASMYRSIEASASQETLSGR